MFFGKLANMLFACPCHTRTTTDQVIKPIDRMFQTIRIGTIVVVVWGIPSRPIQ